MRNIEVCYSPALYPYYRNNEAIVVVADILRATTAICAAFENGARELIPVEGVEEARAWKKKGFLVAAERVKPASAFGRQNNMKVTSEKYCKMRIYCM
jgi:hypothetical protein